MNVIELIHEHLIATGIATEVACYRSRTPDTLRINVECHGHVRHTMRIILICLEGEDVVIKFTYVDFTNKKTKTNNIDSIISLGDPKFFDVLVATLKKFSDPIWVPNV